MSFIARLPPLPSPSFLVTTKHLRRIFSSSSAASISKPAMSQSHSATLTYKHTNQFNRHTRSLILQKAAQTAFTPEGPTMRAVLPDGQGGIKLTRIDVPTPEPHEYLIKIAAIGVNRADLLQVAGKYAPPAGAPDTLGLEASGYLPNGRRVTCLLTGGAFAEFAVVPKSAILPLPARVLHFYSMAQLAAIPEAFIAAYHTLFDIGCLSSGQTVLINAAASGVGISAVQLASSVDAVTVIASAGSHAKLESCIQFGAHHVVNYKSQPTAQIVMQATGGQGVDLAVDCVGAAQFKDIERCLKKNAKWVLYGLLSGAKGSGVGLAGIVIKHLTLTGTTLRGRSLQERGRIIHDFVDRFGECFGPNGSLSPVIHTEFKGLDSAADAFTMMQSNENIGKLVITL